MSQRNLDLVPPEFERVPLGIGFTDCLQPLYRSITPDAVSFGLLVEPQHGNLMGICHGGVLMTLADVTAATGVNQARGVTGGSPTVHLGIDYISAARMGEWIQAKVEQVSVKRRFGFSSGAIYNLSGVVARFSGTFYFPDHDGLWQNDRKNTAATSQGKG